MSAAAEVMKLADRLARQAESQCLKVADLRREAELKAAEADAWASVAANLRDLARTLEKEGQ